MVLISTHQDLLQTKFSLRLVINLKNATEDGHSRCNASDCCKSAYEAEFFNRLSVQPPPDLILETALSSCRDSGIDLFPGGRLSDLEYADDIVLPSKDPGHFTSPTDLNLLICKNTFIEVFEVTSEGLKLIRDVPINAKIVAACLFRRKDRGARMIDQGFDVLIDPGANYIVVRLYHGLLKIILLHCIGEKIGTDLLDTNQWTVNTYNVRIEEGNIVDMAFLHGYSLPTFAMIYEDELVLHMKTYEISGREPALRNVQLTLDSIEPDSKLLIPVPKPYGGVILVGDNIIYYHTKDGPHISQYIPQAKASQVLCYTMVDAQRYLLGDMAGRLYMVHLLPEEASGMGTNLAGTSSSSVAPVSRIGSIRIELLGEFYQSFFPTDIVLCFRF
ncbi:unnamed protein product [Echinostoma caproni]|uniref:DNA damage-binding protein 1 n=1 Tax=Echinostoma caproni TaxID=27848 RepID=A0A183ARG3_9TREM|nr:unnamed protein product [Echinostoma caproni]